MLEIFKEDKVDRKKTFQILLLIMLTSGVFGFLYEELFYYIDLGYLVKRGSTFGPIIPIYVFGGGLIVLFSYRFRKYKAIVFLINCLVTGVLEYATGYVLYEYFDMRLWDYNIEIWNYGNIGGYICLRSILFFGLSSLFLIYIIVPLIKNIALKGNDKVLSVVSYDLGSLFVVDMLLYWIWK